MAVAVAVVERPPTTAPAAVVAGLPQERRPPGPLEALEVARRLEGVRPEPGTLLLRRPHVLRAPTKSATRTRTERVRWAARA